MRQDIIKEDVIYPVIKSSSKMGYAKYDIN